MLGANGENLLLDLRQTPFALANDARDERGNLLHFRFLHAAGRHRRRTDAHAAGHKRAERFLRNGVLVDRDVGLTEQRLERLARHAGSRQIQQHQVIIRTAGDEANPFLCKFRRHRARVQHNLVLIRLKLRRHRLFQADRLARDDMLQRAALRARENRLIDCRGIFLLAEDHAAARAAKRFVGGRRHEIRIRNRAGVFARRDKPRDMRHIHHQQAACSIRDLAQAREINDSRIGRRARDNHLRLGFKRHLFQRIIIDDFFLFRYAVRHEMEILTGHVHRASVRQMTAVGQIHSHHRITRLEHGKIDRHIGLRAGMGLHIGVFRPEKRLGAFARQIFNDIDILAAAVIALSRISFGIFVGQVRAHCGQNRVTDEVFGCNQLQMLALARQFLAHRVADFGINSLDGFEINHSPYLPS